MLLRELFAQEDRPQVAGYTLLNTQHVLDQAEQRGIPRAIIASMLKRVGRARKFIDTEGRKQGVSLWDTRNGVHLIVKKFDDDARNDLMLVTVYRDSDRKYKNVKTPKFALR